MNNTLTATNIEINSEAAFVTQSLTTALRPLLRGENTVIIHSALSKLGFPKNDSYIQGVLDFLTQLVQEGKTVLLPSFTFSFSKRKEYSYTDPSETGVLADLARTRLHFTRTKNPMFSFVVEGPQKDIYLNTRSDSGYGDGTAVSKLVSEDLAVVMLGAKWDCCTVIHAMEEQTQVPYRTYVEWNYPVNFGNGVEEHKFMAFVRSAEYKTTLAFENIREVLVQHGELRQSRLNNTVLEAANAKTVADLAGRMIAENPFYFVALEKNQNS